MGVVKNYGATEEKGGEWRVLELHTKLRHGRHSILGSQEENVGSLLHNL